MILGKLIKAVHIHCAAFFIMRILLTQQFISFFYLIKNLKMVVNK
jgi:hypothetical protein